MDHSVLRWEKRHQRHQRHQWHGRQRHPQRILTLYPMRMGAATSWALATAACLVLILIANPVSAAGAALDVAVLAGPAVPASPTVRAFVFACHDCPISTSYMPEIQRIADAYAAKGVSLCVVLEDSGMSTDDAKAWAADIIPRCPLILDATHALAKRLHPLVTPEAVIIGPDAEVLYCGRIDDLWAALGRSRAHASTHDFCDALDAVLAHHPITQPVAKAIGCIIDFDDKALK